MLDPKTRILAFRLLVLVSCASPAIWLIWQWFFGDLGPVPSEAMVHFTGQTGLILLLITIAFSPAFRLSGWVGVMIARRQIGLWAFFWLLAHLLGWAWLELSWDWEWIWIEIVELPYLRYGLAALLLLVPLVLTSVRRAQEAMGWTAWHWLHRLIYISAALGVTHYWILTRADYLLPSIAVATLAVLVVFRLVDAAIHRQ